ncbi:hypothetical protein S40285_07327 [Stachybotrys chlorohalonatus IBT 40285]|uniref:NmrA-like domain-containing protein n=1 Tax=Stachybotrys chlorohalonatus (strain IBT 40285) TaxID=1283841 RepID=A0A084Q8D2_STAC4|nr:hypothetical protein S40285_07327 [Stachybotrys chlorohalonata IBT 40285]
MVKIAIAGATSQLARSLIDKLSDSGKHEILGLIRKDPAQFPPLPGVEWVQTTYEDELELVKLLQGVHTLLCFFAVHLDGGSATQKRLIDAAVKANVKRYAPSEWSTGEKLDSAVDVIPWYGGKVEVARYLESINKDKEILEYCRFQTGSFLDYLGHPHHSPKHMITIQGVIDFEKRHGLIIKGSMDKEASFTLVEDIVNIVARAVEYEGKWPTIGGISGDRLSPRQQLRIGEAVRGTPFTVDWLEMEDLEAGNLKSEHYLKVDLPSTAADQVEAFSKFATMKILIASSLGLWTVTDEWNRIFPDYKFTKAEEFLTKVWAGKE